MFIDASAIVCIMTGENEAPQLTDRLKAASSPMTSAIAAYEATQAIARLRSCDARLASDYLDEFLELFAVTIVAVGRAEFDVAIDAHARFGKGRHPARLNMGDCFAYACARTCGVPLLYKGDDFALTDVQTG